MRQLTQRQCSSSSSSLGQGRGSSFAGARVPQRPATAVSCSGRTRAPGRKAVVVEAVSGLEAISGPGPSLRPPRCRRQAAGRHETPALPSSPPARAAQALAPAQEAVERGGPAAGPRHAPLLRAHRLPGASRCTCMHAPGAGIPPAPPRAVGSCGATPRAAAPPRPDRPLPTPLPPATAPGHAHRLLRRGADHGAAVCAVAGGAGPHLLLHQLHGDSGERGKRAFSSNRKGNQTTPVPRTHAG